MRNYYRIQNCLMLYLFLLISSLCNLIQAQSDCPPGLVSYWKLDEIGSPGIFLDSFGGNNALCTVGECPLEDTGLLNRARNFLGSSEINVPDDVVYDWGTNTSFTIEVWINTTHPGTGNKVFLGKYRGNSNMSWWLGYGNSNKAIFSVRDSAGIATQLEGITLLNDGDWHHIVGVRNSSLGVLEIFVDGEKENAVSTFFSGDFSGSDPIYIGYYSDSYYYTGLLDEIAIYDTALSENQIANHYTNGLMGVNYCDQSTTVEDEEITLSNFLLYQNYPNPFNPTTKIKFTIPQNLSGTLIKLRIFDVLGNEVAALLNEKKQAGNYEMEFDGKSLSSGIYFYKLEISNFISVKKMILLK